MDHRTLLIISVCHLLLNIWKVSKTCHVPLCVGESALRSISQGLGIQMGIQLRLPALLCCSLLALGGF